MMKPSSVLVIGGVLGSRGAVGTSIGARDFVSGTGCSGTVVELAAIDDVIPAAIAGPPTFDTVACTEVGGVQFCKARSIPRFRQWMIRSGLSILLKSGVSDCRSAGRVERSVS